MASRPFGSNMNKAPSHVRPKQNTPKHASMASRRFFAQTCTRPLPTLGESKTCENMPSSLPEFVYQTCTKPFPTLGQRETCENMPTLLPERKRGSIASSQRLTAKKSFLKNTLRKTSNDACPTATGTTTTKDENSTWPEKYKTCRHRFQNVNMPASLPERF